MAQTDCCNADCGTPIHDVTWLKIAFVLVMLTIVYNLAECGVAVITGYMADSISLIGFGFDSLLEVSAACLMLWRLIEQVCYHSDEAVERAEVTVHRFVGVTFLMLAGYIAYDAGMTLWHQNKPQETIVGIVVAVLSLIIMPLLAWGKLKAANAINSAALRLEAKETVACSILSLILLLGLGMNALLGWWWADPLAAVMMLPWLVKEGWAGLKGQGCCG